MKLLFLGDSITDAGHCFDPDNLGDGYVRILQDRFRSKETFAAVPDISLTNKGIDGFTVPRVYELWKKLPTEPSWDIVSVLAGVNDAGVWMNCGHSKDQIRQNLSELSQTYEDLITDILDQGIPQLLVMEPFIFPCPEKYRLWQPCLREISLCIRSLCQRYNCLFLPLQEILNTAVQKYGYPAITSDGIHLTPQGNRILADAWITAMASADSRFCCLEA